MHLRSDIAVAGANGVTSAARETRDSDAVGTKLAFGQVDALVRLIEAMGGGWNGAKSLNQEEEAAEGSDGAQVRIGVGELEWLECS